ncbi:MAG: hypothetical protein ACR2QK_14200 [Acidimicrobiales bacterium]
MGRFRLRFFAIAILTTMVALSGGAAPAAGAHSDPAIISALDEEGRYLELTESGLDGSIDEANANGVAFAWLDQGGNSAVAVSLADDYVEDLEEIGSRYRTVVVLTSEGFAASSTVYSQAELDRALDASFESFRVGAAGRGIETFSDSVSGALSGGTTATTTGESGGSSGGGIGFGTILLGIAVLGGGFLLIRSFAKRRKAKQQAEIDMEEDRAEIKEQLKNNADRVISLGDKVIARGDRELITRYEEASKTYQDVSQGVDGASTPEEVDALDDRIDHAEWQFEVIEAELDGLPAPRSPAERRAAEDSAPDPTDDARPGMPPPPTGRSIDPPVATSPRTGRQYPRTTGRRRSGGGMGGLGGALGGILGSVILGGGLGGGSRSRRSQRRSGGLGGVLGGGGGRSRTIGTGGGLGGGVLRRGGGSRTSRTRSSRRTNSSGRSRSRSRSRGGRSF